MRGGVWLTLVLQDLNSNHCLLKGRREREKYHPPPHTYMHLMNCTPQHPAIPPQPYIPDEPLSCFIQTPSRSSLSSINSLHTSWIFSPWHSVLLTSETCFSGHQHLLIPNQPTSFHRLTFSFALSRSVLP